MNRIAIRTAFAAAAVAGALTLAPPVLADAEAGDDAPAVAVTTAERYWACVAIDHVEVGACVGNPYPDLSRFPTVPELVERTTGVRLPAVPRP